MNKAFYAFENMKVGGVVINDIPSKRCDPMPVKQKKIIVNLDTHPHTHTMCSENIKKNGNKNAKKKKNKCPKPPPPPPRIHKCINTREESLRGIIYLVILFYFQYGGTKDSGVGKEGIKYAMEDMTEQRLMLMREASTL